MFILLVKVTPKSSKNALAGWEGDYLKIKLRAIPEKGSANEALINFLSEILNIPKSSIKIISGQTSRLKRVQISALFDKKFLH